MPKTSGIDKLRRCQACSAPVQAVPLAPKEPVYVICKVCVDLGVVFVGKRVGDSNG